MQKLHNCNENVKQNKRKIKQYVEKMRKMKKNILKWL